MNKLETEVDMFYARLGSAIAKETRETRDRQSQTKYKYRVLTQGPWTFDGYATSIREYLFPKNESVYILALDDFNLWMQASRYPSMAQSVSLEDKSFLHIEQVRKLLYPQERAGASISNFV